MLASHRARLAKLKRLPRRLCRFEPPLIPCFGYRSGFRGAEDRADHARDDAAHHRRRARRRGVNWIPEAGRELFFVINHNVQDFDEDNRFHSLASDVVAKASYTVRF